MSYFKQNINLAALKHTIIKQKGKTNEVEGIFIPFEANYLRKINGKNGDVYINLNIIAFELKEKKSHATHLLKRSFSKDEQAEIGEDIISKLPLLGNAKIENLSNKNSNQNISTSITEEDIPF